MLFADAHIEWWPGEREAVFQERIKRQGEALRNWREAGAKREVIGFPG